MDNLLGELTGISRTRHPECRVRLGPRVVAAQAMFFGGRLSRTVLGSQAVRRLGIQQVGASNRSSTTR
jgi:hypothetical protein